MTLHFRDRRGAALLRHRNRPFPSSPGPLYQNEVKCSAFDMEMIFHSHANKTHFHKKGWAFGLILKVKVFETRKWPIAPPQSFLCMNRSPIRYGLRGSQKVSGIS